MALLGLLVFSLERGSKAPSARMKRKDIHQLINILKSDSRHHSGVLPVLTDKQISNFQQEADFILPPSFVTFLKEFGSGAEWLYRSQALDSIDHPNWLNTYRKGLSKMTKIFEGGTVPTKSLLCLMTEDSNGGAWCWLTTMRSPDGECSLAYWDAETAQLHFRIDSFTEWLRTLVVNKGEVIRALDKEWRLKLG